MFYTYLRFTGESTSYFSEITGINSAWYSSDARDLYYKMHSLARLVYKLHKNTTNGRKTTFRIYDDKSYFVSDRFYYGQE